MGILTFKQGIEPRLLKGFAMIAAIVILVILVVLGIGYVSIRNGIIEKENRIDNAWETIEVQLQRRNDLIPNLVETVKGYASHESSTLEAVVAARANMSSAKTPEARMEAANGLTSALSRLFAVAESYPELKANVNFQQLQSDLTDTENKISYARMSFNDCVLAYNNAIKTFPGNIVAGSKFQPRHGFEVANDDIRESPKIQF